MDSITTPYKGSFIKKKHFDGLNPQWGGGSRSESTFHVFFFLLLM